MSDNPYAPPNAPVSEVASEALAVRPREVTRAVWLSWSSLIVGQLLYLANALVDGKGYRPILLMSLAIGVPLGLLLAWWINGKILKGRNWARILLLLGVILSPISIRTILLSPVYASGRVLPLVAQGIQVPLSAWGCWLLFTSPGKEWFRKRTV